MRLLLDECVDERLRHLFVGHECHTARYAGFAGFQNGELISAAESSGFHVIITVDQAIPQQQSIGKRNLSIIVLCAQTNRLVDLQRLMPMALVALESIVPGQVVEVRP
jgi:hypothetical protein